MDIYIVGIYECKLNIMGDLNMCNRVQDEYGFSGDRDILNNYTEARNKLSEKLEELGADEDIFHDLAIVCQLSMKVYA